MSVFVKICGLRDAETVDAAVDAGADAVGFVFAESPRRISPKEAAHITITVPANVRRVAVMRHPTDEEWQEVLDIFKPDVLQTDVEDFASIDVPPHVQTWPVIREGTPAAIAALPERFVYEGRVSGTGETVDWTAAAGIARQGQMILAGGLAPNNVAAAIAAANPWGVDVSSGVESWRGQKDIRLIRKFIVAARAVEKNQ